MDVELAAKVTAVTVYSKQAQVTIRGHVTLETGAHRLIVGDLPLSMDTQSIRVAGAGSAQVRLHGVDVRRHYYEETPAKRAQELELSIEGLEDEMQAITDEVEILEAQGRYLEGLRGASEHFARGLALGRTSVEQQSQISQYIHAQDLELRAKGRELARQRRKVNKTLEKTRRELEQLQSARPRERYEAVIELEVVESGELEAEVVYNVGNARWRPLYDVRLAESENGPELVITGFAQITQGSGQDWVDVDLKVSTARTELNRKLPELKPWYVDVYQPPVPRPAPMAARRAAAPMSAQAMLESSPASEQVDTIAEPVAAAVVVEEGGATVSFDVANKGNIPSDQSPHKTLLFESTYSMDLDYVAIPKISEAVYRRVKATNDGVVPLLPGSIQLFVGERYIGTSRIDYVPVGDEVELMLGVEERLTIERELVRREVDKARLRDKRLTQYGYDIEVSNLMAVLVHLEIHDHIPVSRHEDINVKLLSCSPQPAEKTDLNLLEWKMTLEGRSSATISYEYQVEHPRSMKIAGLIE